MRGKAESKVWSQPGIGTYTAGTRACRKLYPLLFRFVIVGVVRGRSGNGGNGSKPGVSLFAKFFALKAIIVFADKFG